ncbi:MAG: STAS domain-containing protein [Treponema sp.]|nr:STAS domain-containing protein [Spirochaetia bacterium]MDY2840099.1 STAS domain-containing protein [Treponema sp.]MDY5124404.1 STAS domain-containing protein [Treponema sp.]
MDNLKVNEKEGANYRLFELNGAFNAYTVGEFQSKLYDYIAKMNVVLNLEKITEMDPTGMGIIMAAYNDAEVAGTKLFLLSPSNEALTVITNTGFKNLFKIINSVTEVD